MLPRIKCNVGPVSWPQGCALAGLIFGLLVCYSSSEPADAEAAREKGDKEEGMEQGLEEKGVIFTKTELKQNGKKEEEVEPRLEGQGRIFAKPEFFLGDKEDVRGEG